MNDELKQRQILQAERFAAQAAAHRDRRERIATAAMAGMLAHCGESSQHCGAAAAAAFAAVAYADALIAELDKEVQP